MDANQSLIEDMEMFCLAEMTRDCDLISTMEENHPDCLTNLTKTGSETIDHIMIAKGTESTITGSGQLPFNLGFDTCAVFADLSSAGTLNLHMDKPVTTEGRRLSSKNSKSRTKYLETVHKQLQAHNVFQRVGELSKIAGLLSSEEKQEYNKLDDTITAALLHAKSCLPKRHNRMWTPELNMLVHKIRYVKLLCTKRKNLM